YRSGWDGTTNGVPLVVGSLPNPGTPNTWSMYETVGPPPDVGSGASAASGTVYAVCDQGTTFMTGVVVLPALVMTPDPVLDCPSGSSLNVCTAHWEVDTDIACPAGVLVAGAGAPFPVSPSGLPDSVGYDSSQRIGITAPSAGPGIESDDVMDWR